MERNPTLAQWRLARQLRQLRGDRKFNDVVKALRTSGGSLARWETPGDRGAVPGPAALERLCQVYEATERFEELMELRRQARRPDYWQPYDLERSYRTYANVEAQASVVEMFHSQLVPGLVQTEAYARAVIEATLRPNSDVDREVEVRKERQAVLESERPPHLKLVIAEGALRQQVGPPAVMAEQVRRLITLSGDGAVSLRVLPFSAGAHPGMRRTSFVILRVEEEELEAVYIEGQDSSRFSSEQEEIADYSSVFEHLQAVSTEEGKATRSLLESIAQVHEQREE
nr:helix-turn-helix transcriptional regulator [Nocardiopsis potens]